MILAALYEKENQLDKAQAVLLRGIQQDGNNPELRFQIGELYDKMGNFEKMETEMREALRLNPDYADALNYLGYSFAERGVRLQEALTLIQKAMALKPNQGYITDSLGWVYFKLGEYEKAVTELEKANQLTPDDSTITEHLADGYAKLNRVNKAIEAYDRALTLEPKPDQMERIKGKLKELKGKK
jgi:Flp pilus assembly protein TadD